MVFAAGVGFLGVAAAVAAFVVLAGGADFLDLAAAAALLCVAFFVGGAGGAGAGAAFFLGSGFLDDEGAAGVVSFFAGLLFSRSSRFLFRSSSLSCNFELIYSTIHYLFWHLKLQ